MNNFIRFSSGILLMICLIGARDRASAQSLPDFQMLHNTLKTYEFPTGEITAILSDSTVCKCNISKGMLNGLWTSFYKNGNIKATGQFSNNTMIGSWKVFNESGKSYLQLEFDNDGSYKLNRVRYGFLNNPVRKGKGKVHFSAFGSSGYDVDYAYTAIVKYRNGKKNGKVEELFSNDTLRASYTFKDGSYDGEYIFQSRFNQRSLKGQYKDGIPIGKWTYTATSGERITDWDETPFVQRIPGRTYISEHEVIISQITKKIIHSSFDGVSELFEPDSNGVSVFSLLQNAFIFDESAFYDDDQLRKLVVPSANRPGLTGFDMSKENSMKPVMIFYNDFYFYSAQSSNIKNTALIFTMVMSYSDEKGIERLVSIPFIYLPEAFVSLKDKKIHNKTLGELFLGILNNNYSFVTVYIAEVKDRYLYEYDENWLSNHFNPILNLMNMTHDLWLYNTGIIR
jgi:hypothetical protein